MADLTYSTLEYIEDSVTYLHGVYNTGKPRRLDFRGEQLERLYYMVKDNEELFYEALQADIGRPRTETLISDIAPVLSECMYFIKNLDRLTRDRKVKPRMLFNAFDPAIIKKDPLGVVAIFSTWNYPVQLAFVPLAGAIAAGNAVILKLSEVASHTAALITKLFPMYMDVSCYRIVNGAVEQATGLLNQRLDHIFYTGNSTVGKIVMEAAAKQLTPVTLELGGKSPCVVTEDSHLSIAAHRAAYGKFFNGGQTCTAVDYILVHSSIADAFEQEICKALKHMYGENVKASEHYCRMISTRHTERLARLINDRKSGKVIFGGEIDIAERFIAPTVISHVDFNDSVLMSDEIFGPILPIVTYETIDDAISMITSKESPLALYVFSNNSSVTNRILECCPSGGACINDTLVHQAEYALPFGGVGHSGIGSYHGDKSFETFTHERSILKKTQRLESIVATRYPPYINAKPFMLRSAIVKPDWVLFYYKFQRSFKLSALVIIILLLLAQSRFHLSSIETIQRLVVPIFTTQVEKIRKTISY